VRRAWAHAARRAADGRFNCREGLVAVLERIPEQHWQEAFELAKQIIAEKERHPSLRERVADVSDADLEKLLARTGG
jgi:hypothetical protein